MKAIATRLTLLERHRKFFPPTGQWGRLALLSSPSPSVGGIVNAANNRILVSPSPAGWVRGTRVRILEADYYLIPIAATEWQIADTPQNAVDSVALDLGQFPSSINLAEQPATPDMGLEAILAREVARAQVNNVGSSSSGNWGARRFFDGGGLSVPGGVSAYPNRVWLVGSTISATIKSTAGVVAAFLDLSAGATTRFDARVFDHPVAHVDRNDYKKGGIIRAGTGNYSPWIVCACTLDDPDYYYFLEPGESTSNYTGYPNRGTIDLFICGVFESSNSGFAQPITGGSSVTLASAPLITSNAWRNPYQQLAKIYYPSVYQYRYAMPGAVVLSPNSNSGQISSFHHPVTINERNLPRIGANY